MTIPPIDLSALDGFDAFGPGAETGKPLLLELSRVHEDPNQPRKSFDDGADLIASVAGVGVKVPISVRRHPDRPEHYMVKFGARRRRAALAAGLTHIPAWIDDVPSDFEQVIENLQRANLSPMELAGFMAEKVTAGIKHADIARKLGLSRTAVTKHLALIDAPAEIEAVYRAGRSTSPETLFELRSVFIRFPEETRNWLASDVEVSRRTVEALKQRLMTGTGPQETAGDPGTAKARRQPVGDPGDIKRPRVAVKVGERHGMLVLTRRSVDDAHVLVKWDDTAETSDVACRDIELLRVDDARRYEPLNRGLTAPSRLRGADDVAGDRRP